MRVEAESTPLGDIEADLHVIGLAEGETLPEEYGGAHGADEVKTSARKTMLLRPDAPPRLLVVGLGKPEGLDAESLRVAAALAAKGAKALNATRIAWQLPSAGGLSPAVAATAVVEGTVLTAYSFDSYKGTGADPDKQVSAIESLTIATNEDVGEEIRVAEIAARAQNRARDLQNTPANVCVPSWLAARAEELAAEHEKLSVEILDRAAITERGLGGLAAVGQGSVQEPRLIALRHAGGGSGPVTGFVGKAVTFDSGGISIKPSLGMQDMKMDMSGGAAVLEAMGAIAELDLPLELVAVVPSTENLPSGSAFKPGDIITQLNGKTIEITNTDAEGRLILADALTWAVREMGAERLVDLATLTGAVLVALGSTFAGLVSNDDEWAAAVHEAGDVTGEINWRLPLHREFRALLDSDIADMVNTAAARKAGTIYAGSYLQEFVEDKPWVHLDIAGTAWDTGREYWGKGPTGYGVRTLVELARTLAA